MNPKQHFNLSQKILIPKKCQIQKQIIIKKIKFRIKMSNSKQKSPNIQIYSDYLIENNYFCTNVSEPAHHYKTHQRKSSQVSTRSSKSKLRNFSSAEKNHSHAKPSQPIIQSMKNTRLKSSKTEHKKSILKKEFSIDKIRLTDKANKILTTKRKQKLKIHSDNKHPLKIIENLTSRYIKYKKVNISKTDKSSSHSSFLNKLEHVQEKIKMEKRKKQREERILKNLKVKQKNLQLVVSRCQNVMQEYYQRITNLKKENELLKIENEQLKKHSDLLQSFEKSIK